MMIQNNLIRLQKGFLALMSVSLLFACSQVDTFEAEDMFALRSSAIVQEDCYEGDVSTAVAFSGAYQNKQTVSLNVSNDAEFVYLDFTSSTAILYINGERVNKKDGAHQMKVTHDEFASMNTFEVRRTGEGHGACAPGNCLVLDASAYRIVEKCEINVQNCKGVLETVQNENKVTFTFTPCADLKEGEVSITTPQIENHTALDGKIYTEQGNTLKWTGEFVEGVAITFELEFTPDCNSKGSNLVTNFNVKGEGNHLKDNVTFDCPSSPSQANKGKNGK